MGGLGQELPLATNIAALFDGVTIYFHLENEYK